MQWPAVRRTLGVMNSAVHMPIRLGFSCVGLGMTRRPTHLNGAWLGLPLVASVAGTDGVTMLPIWATRAPKLRGLGSSALPKPFGSPPGYEIARAGIGSEATPFGITAVPPAR